MGLRLYACQGCPIAISNRVENRNVGIIDQMAHNSQNNICVKQACWKVPHISRCPSLPYLLDLHGSMPIVGTMPSKHDISTQCWTNTGPPATTLAQHRSNIGSMSRACWVVYMAGDSPFIARRVNRAALCAEWLHPIVYRFQIKNTIVQCFNSGPASQTVAQYKTNIVYLVWTVKSFPKCYT